MSNGIAVDNRLLVTLGRVYFFALLPFVGSAIAPWVLGPEAPVDLRILLLWSFTLLVLLTGIFLGYALVRRRFIYLHGFVACVVLVAAIGAMAAAMADVQLFAAVALMAVLHWAAWLWVQRAKLIAEALQKSHNRFIWTALTCHMFVLFNMVYAAKTAV